MFSQTGSEISNLIDEIGIQPYKILTTNTNKDTINPKIISEFGDKLVCDSHDKLMQYLRDINRKDVQILITLHGYLRIIPPDVCDIHQIFNGHPALINHYPELKGKDPQEKTWENREKYQLIGSVIHSVTKDVDSGVIYTTVEYPFIHKISTKEKLYEELKLLSLISWTRFFYKEVIGTL